jgi:branched-subunit amino acid aminotransferase/4-amino-4-deoxychorismate lyase
VFAPLVSGVFTTARVTARAIVAFDAHRTRLEEGAERLAKETGLSFTSHLKSLLEVAVFEEKIHDDAMARLALGVDAEGRPGHFSEFAPPRRKRRETGDVPLTLATAEDPRTRVDIKRFPRDDLRRIEDLPAHRAADGVVLTRGDRLCEGTWFHLLARVGDLWFTPPLGQVIAGTTRSRVLCGLTTAGARVSERDLTIADVPTLDGLYALSALIEVAPIGRVNGHPIPTKWAVRDLAILERAFRG